MAYDLKMSDLAAMTEHEVGTVLLELEREATAPRNGQLAMLNARIRELETRYEMPSDEMLRRLEGGQIKETADIARWLYLLDARENRVRGA